MRIYGLNTEPDKCWTRMNWANERKNCFWWLWQKFSARRFFVTTDDTHSLTHTHTTHLSAPINSTIKHNSWNVHTAHDSVAASRPSLRLYRLQKNVSRVRRANTKRIRLALVARVRARGSNEASFSWRTTTRNEKIRGKKRNVMIWRFIHWIPKRNRIAETDMKIHYYKKREEKLCNKKRQRHKSKRMG